METSVFLTETKLHICLQCFVPQRSGVVSLESWRKSVLPVTKVKYVAGKKTYISTNAVVLININLSELDGKIFLFKLVGTLSTKVLTGVSQVWQATSNKLKVN